MSLTGLSPYNCSLQAWRWLLGVGASSDEQDPELGCIYPVWTTTINDLKFPELINCASFYCTSFKPKLEGLYSMPGSHFRSNLARRAEPLSTLTR